MARCWWPDSQKSSIAVEKAFSSCGKAEWRTYSAHFLLISLLIRITVTFWCSLRTTNNINDELLATLFYDVHYYFACITANMEAFRWWFIGLRHRDVTWSAHVWHSWGGNSVEHPVFPGTSRISGPVSRVPAWVFPRRKMSRIFEKPRSNFLMRCDTNLH